MNGFVVGIDENDLRFGNCFTFRNISVRSDYHEIAFCDKVSRRTVDADASATATTGNDVGLDACAVGVVHHLHTLAGVDISGIHQILVDRDATHVLEVSFRNLNAVNLGFEYL